ncbi:clathrin light chain-domain-containing protein [Russula earlei]|uniref:Clathrin light chain-domain-containing protein n=1 Tax=Russula earlei TaxID=71964 RepID=A0ACC0UJQ9_9AGAM|nr:clathrin light chain-domain-containing protein [Russula earlei]
MADLLDDADIDFERAANAFPDISLDGEDDIPSFTSPPTHSLPAPGGPFDLDAFGTPAPARAVRVTGHDQDDDIGKFESEFPELDTVNFPPSQPTFGALPPFAPRPQPSALSATPILVQPIDAEEPDVIRQWRERQAEEIKARDERSKTRRQETISKAERAIDQFYEDYNAMRKRQIRDNKDSEADYVAKLSDSLSRGTTWDRICDFVELQNSQSKTLARAGPGTTELSRYREVLLRLRREGASAPGAAGY